MKETLCWKCKRPGSNTCSWDRSRGEIPVDGWTAKETKRWSSKGKYIKAYHIISCPLFLLDEDYVKRMKNIIETQEGKFSEKRRKRIEEIENLIHYGWTDKAIASRFGISVKYVQKIKYRWREKQEEKRNRVYKK